MFVRIRHCCVRNGGFGSREGCSRFRIRLICGRLDTRLSLGLYFYSARLCCLNGCCCARLNHSHCGFVLCSRAVRSSRGDSAFALCLLSGFYRVPLFRLCFSCSDNRRLCGRGFGRELCCAALRRMLHRGAS